jgi:16S rRNA (cytosine1402-N4)-methyltransferase
VALGDGHASVLQVEAVDALVFRQSGFYVDGTYGRGGHTAEILSRLDGGGRVLAIDKDPAAIADGAARFVDEPRLQLVHGSFATLAEILAVHGVPHVDGVLMDLGVSSPQLDDPARGFSFMHDGPLDMRMDPGRGVSAAEWLMLASEREISQALKEYGEERFARRIARAVVEFRDKTPLARTSDLVAIIEASVPRVEKHKHPATRAFQALRIVVNQELEELATGLQAGLGVLSRGGRLVVISFHSLEDRIVKRFMRHAARGDDPGRLPVKEADIRRDARVVGKAVKAGDVEVSRNRRARSAVMRVAERT